MDYKKGIDLIGFCAEHLKLNGLEWRILALLIRDSNHKTNMVTRSLREITEKVKSFPASVFKGVDSLENLRLIETITPARGRQAATYQVSTREEMIKLIGSEQENPAYETWYLTKRDLYGLLEEEEEDLKDAITGCQECTPKKLCPFHQAMTDKILSSMSYTQRTIWEDRHPEPGKRAYFIDGIEVG